MQFLHANDKTLFPHGTCVFLNVILIDSNSCQTIVAFHFCEKHASKNIHSHAHSEKSYMIIVCKVLCVYVLSKQYPYNELLTLLRW